ncbi:hypothetical protein LOZ65_005464 [Ophidiomyces ophidiicola]|nr:hypothetical protein LOZ65_005464 [Ophidiomyces ophidiicola]
MDLVSQHRSPETGWEYHCYNSLKKSFGEALENLTHGLTDKVGRPVSVLDANTWGIDINTCNTYCNTEALPWPNFNFKAFSAAFTSYLLPWLALTAQLPYETGNPWSDIMSLCIALGSPAMITYSLTITMLNRYWVRREFRFLLGSLRRHTRLRYKRQICAVQYFLAEVQQVPLQLPSDFNVLRQHLQPEMEKSWTRLSGRLRRSRRGVTASLVAQVLSAAVAYTFTVISSFVSSIESLDSVMQITAGTLWAWLVSHSIYVFPCSVNIKSNGTKKIPIVCGWVIVGTQSTHDAIEDALRMKYLNTSYEPHGAIEGLENPSENEDNTKISVRLDRKDRNQPNMFGLSFAGDELHKGPVYNYARVFTWWQAVHHFMEAIKSMDQPQLTRDGQYSQPGKPHDQMATDSLLESEITELPAFNTGQYMALYPKFSDLPPDLWWRMVIASVMALIIQWGTTGASALMAYLTPVQGLGCRSGSYTIYGILGTLAWMVLVASMLFSHAAMSSYPLKSYRNAFFGRIAVFLRGTGKFIAILNAAWLVCSTIFENVGFYDNCWCHAVVLGYGEKAWAILFRTPEEFRHEAKNSWPGGIALTMIVCTLSVLVYLLGSGDDSRLGEDEYD